ncbi:Na(+)/H(+) antiporter subunit C [Streptomyces sp. DSM 41982]|uniref:Na(+)/H(+) antiporter subunit C n=1 Tax=Streptomyces evansiae TaxID=3075535 RepID=A0ABD5E680_9ACTN|nr:MULTISPECIES: Na(+)/H(+) antiporter subunit C [unclassified Streptomyces]MDT0416894.1 Na(+)/H(+) antiporter subunit C [Streptomyces sp. DSM 41982]SCD65601.1 multisubunit sodium/proton antiporter, MrpC subunit [Streptomyces sp. SolWspMP-sol7th]
MTLSLAVLVSAVVLCAVGGALVLTRSLTRILLGTVVLGNGANLLVLASTGSAAEPPLLYPRIIRNRVTDPLPQAVALTAIVIALATTAFLLALAYRTHQVTGSDEVRDDTEDRLVALRAEVLDERSALRARYREIRATRGHSPRARARYRAERKELRARLRADRAYQARARDASGDLWNDILGADPEDYADPGDQADPGDLANPGDSGGTGPGDGGTDAERPGAEGRTRPRTAEDTGTARDPRTTDGPSAAEGPSATEDPGPANDPGQEGEEPR